GQNLHHSVFESCVHKCLPSPLPPPQCRELSCDRDTLSAGQLWTCAPRLTSLSVLSTLLPVACRL
ncbi:MAG: hypothetical protein ACK55Z_33965, partial [bacterium]